MESGQPNTSMKEEANESPQRDLKAELPFKKPTLLIGKIGRLPRKVHPISVISKNSETVKEDSNNKKSADHMGSIIIESLTSMPTEPKVTIENPSEMAPNSSQQETEKPIAFPYKEPSWSGLPVSNGKLYALEILKNGTTIDRIDLMSKPFWTFGRSVNCDVWAQHPTISRNHAVLQFRGIPTEKDPPGFYLYDLGSTHGTFLNGRNRIMAKVYVPVRVGHFLRLGCSERSYFLTGPEEDQEEESELSVTELKQLRDQKKREREETIRLAKLAEEERKKRDEEKGVDWGMGDDAEDEGDIIENPYASTNNEELYLDDPKKALRGFFEREGVDLEYDCNEQGMGQFFCKVELPLDDEMGRPIVAEVLHRGKKKEAVIQCALEACRILDRFGVLRQATHESRKRRARDWKENDYYDSDDDTFLDRTGAIEKKREKRMKVKEPEKAQTYESLIQKEKEITASIADIEKKLSHVQTSLDKANASSNPDEDSLDMYMKGLNDDKPDKQTVSKLKSELSNLRQSHANIVRLINVAKPTNLPPLTPENSVPSASTFNRKLNLPIFGKRKAVPVKFPVKPTTTQDLPRTSTVVEEESEEEAEDVQISSEMAANLSRQSTLQNSPVIPMDSKCDSSVSRIEEAVANTNDSIENFSFEDRGTTGIEDLDSEQEVSRDLDSSDESTLPETSPVRTSDNKETFKQFEAIMKTGLPALAGKHKEKLVEILSNIKSLALNDERIRNNERKWISAKKRKLANWITKFEETEGDEKLEHKVSIQTKRVFKELNALTKDKIKVIGQAKEMEVALKAISEDIDRDIQELQKRVNILEYSSKPGCSSKNDFGDSSDDLDEEMENVNRKNYNSDNAEGSLDVEDKKKKKNQKRNEQRQYKAELEKQKGYQEDAARENYNMWVPPKNQSGDGRTSLNDKYGY